MQLFLIYRERKLAFVVISSDSPFREVHNQFTMVLLNSLSHCIDFIVITLLDIHDTLLLNKFNSFLTKVDKHFPTSSFPDLI